VRRVGRKRRLRRNAEFVRSRSALRAALVGGDQIALLEDMPGNGFEERLLVEAGGQLQRLVQREQPEAIADGPAEGAEGPS
jgi:hypothetical protein